jgi:cytochrome b
MASPPFRRTAGPSRGINLPMPVWDLPTRLFHWVLVACIAVSYVSVRRNAMNVHLLSGYTVAGLLLFRIVWGLVGSDSARFRTFLRSPLAAIGHLRDFFRREPDTETGHNAAGGWMVLVMLLVLLVQVGTGLFSNDDGDTEGPLAKFVEKSTSDYLSGIHAKNFNVLLALMGLHVLAIIAYAAIKRQNLALPMITGKKRLPAATPAPRMMHPLLALLIALLAAAAVTALVKLS